MSPMTPEGLQIHKYKQDLVKVINDNRFLVVVGDTGSGKTTQIPQYLLDEKKDDDGGEFLYKKIIVTQPRRIAAISAARRVSEERNTELGGSEVGYSVRFEKFTSYSTRLTYTTDGTLLRELISNPKVDNVDVIILDEAHERSLQTDVLIGFLRNLKRSDHHNLKVIIMSATLDHKKFSQFFDNAPVFMIPGRQYPVEIHWLDDAKLEEMESVYVSLCVEGAYQIHINEEPGDILVFLTGRMEIEKAIFQLTELLKKSSVEGNIKSSKVSILPIFSTLEMSRQRCVFDPAAPGYRKIIFATNIAQTSITIPGVRYIVDSGFVKQKIYDTATGVNALVLVPISRTASIQRAGRAGRTSPGKVYRLYSQEDFKNMSESTTPQIQRSSLVGVILLLKQMGIQNIIKFPLIDPTDFDLVVPATKQLYLLEAIDRNGNITRYGKIMNMFPISPFLSKAIISAALDFGYINSVVDVVSILSSEPIFLIPAFDKRRQAEAAHRALGHESGDHITLLNIMKKWRECEYLKDWCSKNYLSYRALDTARKIARKLREVCCSVFGNCNNLPNKENVFSEEEAVIRSFCSGFYMNTTRKLRKSGVYYHYLTSLLTKSNNNIKNISESVAPELELKKRNCLFDNHTYKDTGLLALFLHSSSVLYNSNSLVHILDGSDAEWLICSELYYSKRPMMRVVSKIKYKWIEKYIKLPLQPINCDALCGNSTEHPSHSTKIDKNGSGISTPVIISKEVSDDQNNQTPYNKTLTQSATSIDNSQLYTQGSSKFEKSLSESNNHLEVNDATRKQEMINAAIERYKKRKKLKRK